MYISKRSGMDHTVLPANTIRLPFLCKLSPDGANPNWVNRHPIAAYYSSVDAEGMKVSWPGWLTYSGRFTHICDHPSSKDRVQDRESSPVKDRRSTAVPHNQHQYLIPMQEAHKQPYLFLFHIFVKKTILWSLNYSTGECDHDGWHVTGSSGQTRQ